MTWNYRIVREKDNTLSRWFYRVCEVYYDDEWKPYSFCDATIAGDTLVSLFVEEVPVIVEGMRKAFLTYPDDFEGEPPAGESE